MITEAEREEIINLVVERVFLKIPEMVGVMMSTSAAKMKASREFYEKYPEFSKYKDIVASVIEQLEGEGSDYSSIMEDSIPLIRDRIAKVKGLDMKEVSRPRLDYSHGEL